MIPDSNRCVVNLIEYVYCFVFLFALWKAYLHCDHLIIAFLGVYPRSEGNSSPILKFFRAGTMRGLFTVRILRGQLKKDKHA